MRPLEGVRVVELATWVAAPTCGAILAECGAQVVKVERMETQGDGMRGWSVSDEGAPSPTYNFLFDQANRNKRSVALNLRTPGGREALFRLLEGADVFLTNLTSPSLERLGLDPASLRERFPALVYAYLTGYGLKGPDRHRPGFDVLAYWARSGMQGVHGEPDAPPPLPHGSLGDFTSAVFLFAGILLALRERERTGRGRLVDVSLYHAGLWVLSQDHLAYFYTGRTVPRFSRHRPPNPLNNTYLCADGKWLQLCLFQSDRYWPGLCRALGLTGLLDDPRFSTLEGRRRHSAQLVEILDSVFITRPRGEWARRLDAEGVLWGPVHSVEEACHDPQAEDNGYFVEAPHPDLGTVRQVAIPFRLEGEPFRPYAPAPEFGQHTEEVLLEVGYTWDDLGRLKEEGAILA